MTENKRNTSPEDRKPDPGPPQPSNTNDEREERYQNRDRSASEKEEEEREEERYMTRSRSRNDRPGMWGYKNWDPRKNDEPTDQASMNNERENDRALSKDPENEDGPTSLGKGHGAGAGEDPDH